MSTWFIGDVHGCARTLERLVSRLEPLAEGDRIWLVGDLVNRGPASAQVLRWASTAPGVDAVLGNHDLHLLARAAGLGRVREGDTVEDVLTAPDRDCLVEWLRRRPLLVAAPAFVLVHAGLLPSWEEPEAAARAAEAEEVLRGHRTAELLGALARRSPAAELAAAVESASVMTRVRMVESDGSPRRGFNGPPAEAPPGTSPWFESSPVPRRERPVIFGHWAMLGLYRAPGTVCLDSGCVYGGRLSAFRLEDGALLQEPLAAEDAPG